MGKRNWHNISKKRRVFTKMVKRTKKRRREKERRAAKVVDEYGREGNSACGRKMRYESKSAAERYISNHSSASPLSTYRCPYCGGWHITSHPRE